MSHNLRQPALVLNRSWQPVNVASVARALILVWNDQAKVVEPSDYQLYNWQDWSRMAPRPDEPYIQAVSARLRIPEVIALNRYDRMPAATVVFNRRNLFRRDRHTCQYCGCHPAHDELTIDHVVPRSHGGTSSWTNCVLACVACNHRKADRTPAEARMRLSRDPVQPRWNPGYWRHTRRIDSWQKFINDAYWNSDLEE